MNFQFNFNLTRRTMKFMKFLDVLECTYIYRNFLEPAVLLKRITRQTFFPDLFLLVQEEKSGSF